MRTTKGRVVGCNTSQVPLVLKNLPSNAGVIRDGGSIPESERYPGEGNGNPLQYSCLENPMDKGAWQATVHGVAKSWIHLKSLSTCRIYTRHTLIFKEIAS